MAANVLIMPAPVTAMPPDGEAQTEQNQPEKPTPGFSFHMALQTENYFTHG